MIPRSFSTVLAALLLSQVALAERVNICNMQRFSQASGTSCTFTSRPGEEIRVNARYYDTTLNDYARVWLDPYGNSVSVPANQSRSITRRIGANAGGITRILFQIPHFAGGDFLDTETFADRSNLYTHHVELDPNTGLLSLVWGVSTNTDFVPVHYVPIKHWANVGQSGYEQFLGQWNLDPCVNRGPCSNTIHINFADRVPIDLGKSWIVAKIDPDDRHAETNENATDNRKLYNLDPDGTTMFHEEVPGIMRAHADNWSFAGLLLDRWFSARQRIKASPGGFDWSLFKFISNSTNWLRNPLNSSTAVINNFNTLVSPDFFDTSESRGELRDIVIGLFQERPQAQTVQLSEIWQEGGEVRPYHRQHITHREGQSSYSVANAAGAALGRFSFYLVPRGTATKENAAYFRVNINQVAIHVTDSFDFNGGQNLGCWALPDRVFAPAFPGSQCLSNDSFRYYRKVKARGEDFIVFLRPVVVNLPSVLSFRLRRP